MGTVELAMARGAAGVERLVAIKRIRSHLTSATEVVSRFLDEARIISQLHHANVVGLHHASEDDRGYYLVFDYVEGETLSGLIDLAEIRHQKVPLPIVVRIILDALNGLHAAHDAKNASGEALHILHRDVSKQNLLIGRDGVTRLSDFGISKSVLHSTVTNQSYIAGKLIYMPPEYLSRAPVDRRMDVYAIGVTFWTAIAGREPWPDLAEAQTLSRILNEGIPPVSTAGVTVPPEIEAIVARACQARPSDRFTTARQMIDALEEFGKRTGTLASQTEVAEYVEVMAGEFLDDRRRAIAQRLLTREEMAPSTIPPGGTPSEQAGAGAGAPKDAAGWTDTDDAVPRRNIVTRKHFLIAAGAMVVVAATLAIVTRGPSASKTSVLAPSSAVLVPSSIGPAPVATTNDREPRAPALAASATDGTASIPAPSTSAIAKNPRGHGQPPGGAQPRSKPASAAPGDLAAPAIPTQISTANPYR
jgi:serine/threonine-protein kinase